MDVLNHIVLYVANRMHFGQWRNAKKYIVFVPAVLFTFFGFSTFHEILFGHPEVHQASTSLVPVLVG